MSVEIKTPTRVQFEHAEFLCGERQTASPGHASIPQVNQIITTTDDLITHNVEISSKNVNQEKNIVDDNENKQIGKRRRLSQHYHGAHKKRRHSMKAGKFELPSQFLFGGTISDPLNLKSLCDSEGVPLSQVTPHSSPLPAPIHRMHVEVLTPVNIKDPLNLSAVDDESPIFEKSGVRKKKRKRSKPDPNNMKQTVKGDSELNVSTISSKSDSDNPSTTSHNVNNVTINMKTGSKCDLWKKSDPNYWKKKKRTKHSKCSSDSELSVSNLDIESMSLSLSNASQPLPICNILNKDENNQLCSEEIDKNLMDKPLVNIPPVIKEIVQSDTIKKQVPLSPRKRKQHHQHTSNLKSKLQVHESMKSHPKHSIKKQLPIYHKFMYGNYNRYYGYRNPNLNEDPRIDCLNPDWFSGKRVLDIGCNVGHVTLGIAYHFRPRKIVGMDIDGHLIGAARKNIRHYVKGGSDSSKLPVSSCVTKGPLAASPTIEGGLNPFPANVMFIQGNYVIENDSQLHTQQEEYDVIIAFSVTKWIHLNWGDDGLKRFFQRVYRHLKPGGKFILEAQPWSSYGKKKKITETIYNNYHSIRFRPQDFKEYLLSEQVGFDTFQLIDIPHNQSKGFQRPLELYIKADSIAEEEVIPVSLEQSTHEQTSHARLDSLLRDSTSTLQSTASSYSVTPSHVSCISHVTSTNVSSLYTDVQSLGSSDFSDVTLVKTSSPCPMITNATNDNCIEMSNYSPLGSS